jgi:hypothetical protein
MFTTGQNEGEEEDRREGAMNKIRVLSGNSLVLM